MKELKDFLTFTGRDKNGILVLCLIIACSIAIPHTMPYIFGTATEPEIKWISLEKNELQEIVDDEDLQEIDQTIFRTKLKTFDPNSLEYKGALELGLPKKVASNIDKYLKKGGRFYKKEDLLKIYNLNDSIYQAIQGYVSIKKPEYLRSSKPSKGPPQVQKNSLKLSENRNLFLFNPNELDLNTIKTLGIPKKVFYNLKKYLDSGGQILSKQDFRKIYGLTDQEYTRLKPFIDLPATRTKQNYENYPEASKAIKESATPSNEILLPERVNKKKEIEEDHLSQWVKYEKPKKAVIGLNKSNRKEWESISGIGPVFSGRIVKYRELVGGFYKKEQLLEVFGITDSLLKVISPFINVDEIGNKTRQFDINSVTISELISHPYIEYKLAKKIVRIREKHGKYSTLNGLLDFEVLTSEELDKIKAYLKVVSK